MIFCNYFVDVTIAVAVAVHVNDSKTVSSQVCKPSAIESLITLSKLWQELSESHFTDF